MPRDKRQVIANVPHHVYMRGNNRRRLFSRRTDFAVFVALLANALCREPCLLHALTLMTNHVHMLVTPLLAAALPRLVKDFAQRYAYLRNRARAGSGKLFEQRYKCVPILTHEGMARETAYIDLNAKHGGLADDPLDYPWSTYAIHAGEPMRSAIPLRIWTPSDWYLALDGDADSRAAQYRAFAEAYSIDYSEKRASATCSGKDERRPDGSRAL